MSEAASGVIKPIHTYNLRRELENMILHTIKVMPTNVSMCTYVLVLYSRPTYINTCEMN